MSGRAVSLSASLIDDLADFLADLDCQFWACNGQPTTDPIDMKTCSRCMILGRLLNEKNGGEPA